MDDLSTVLSSIFGGFAHEDACASQSSEHCLRLFDAFVEFASSDKDWKHASTLDRVCSELKALGNSNSITLFPAYGAVLLAVKGIGCSSATHYDLILRGLDDWRFNVKANLSTPGRQWVSRSGYDVHLCCGKVRVDTYAKFINELVALKVKAEARRERLERSAAGGKQGHQKTPAFISCLVKQAVESLTMGGLEENELLPPGAFTDVGLHTGGKKRGTAWPLCKAVICFLIERAIEGDAALRIEDIPRNTLARFDVWLLERQLKKFTKDNATPKHIDVVMKMLEAAAAKGSALSENGHDMEDFERRCAQARKEIDKAVAKRHEDVAASKFALPELNAKEVKLRDPVVALPDIVPPRAGAKGLKEAKQRSKVNIEWIPTHCHDDGELTWEVANAWLDDKRILGGKSAPAQLALSVVEKMVFSKVLSIGRNKRKHQSHSAMEKDARNIEALIERYRNVLHGFRKAGGRSFAELRSKEMLVVWAAYCLIHAKTLVVHDLLGQHDVALQFKDLRHLVLREKLSYDAHLAVAAYLRAHSKTGRPVFSLRRDDVTFDMAETFSRNDSHIQRVLAAETEAAEMRKSNHFKEVVRKQAKAAMYRKEVRESERKIGDLEISIERRRTLRDHYSTTSSSHWKHNKELDSLLRQCRIEKSSLNSSKSSLKSAEAPITPVFQPLPSKKSLANQALFFLHMPEMFRVLSRMSFTARQMLMPRTRKDLTTCFKKLEVKDPKSSWSSYYNEKQDCKYHDPTSRFDSRPCKVPLMSTRPVPKEDDIRPKHIDSYYSSSDGVWHPDHLSLTMFWKGGDFELDRRETFFDPFKVGVFTAEIIVDEFTERLTQDEDASGKDSRKDHTLQWALSQCGEDTPRDRGNMALAQQENKPSWLTKREYLNFTNLRAFPNQQLRKICGALRDRALPFVRPEVHILLKQALFHVGDLDEEGSIWKQDFFKGDGWKILTAELEDLAQELDQTPRDWGASLLLGEISAWASQWEPSCRSVARHFASTLRDWGKSIKKRIDESSQDHEHALRAQQSILFMCSLACHRNGYLCSDDIRAICELIALTHHACIFDDETPFDSELKSMKIKSENVMASRIAELLRGVEEDPSILTSMARVVIEDVPSELKWVPCAYSKSCFEAVTHDGHLYSVNVLTGTILFDGLPPSRLSREVLDHPLYVRTFGETNFEVKRFFNGMVRTISHIDGYVYEFYLTGAKASKLVVREMYNFCSNEMSENVGLVLLDGTRSGIQTWGADLPVRLQELYSHWYCPERQCVVLRPLSFRERGSCFYATINPGSSEEPRPLTCYRVPRHLRSQPWFNIPGLMLASSFDQLKKWDSISSLVAQLVGVFTKFETERYIHMYVRKNCNGLPKATKGGARSVVMFSFPRFNLEFEIERDVKLRLQGKLYSTTHKNFYLSPVQQLDHTLFEFQRYLVLERKRGTQVSQRILIPHGEVKSTTGTELADVKFSDASGAQIDVHIYDLNPRFKNLETRTRFSRLHLAALSAATGTLLPELSAAMTGEEAAMRLVRQCWVNKPLTRLEHEKLCEVARQGRRIPGLTILCHELSQSSSQLRFLYPDLDFVGDLPLDQDAATEYCSRKSTAQELNFRSLLTDGEEKRVLGAHIHSRHPGRIKPRYGNVEIGLGVWHIQTASEKSIDLVGGKLLSLVIDQREPGTGSRTCQGMPISFPIFKSELKREILQELQKSLDAFNLLPNKRMLAHACNFEAMHGEITQLRQKFEAEILHFIDAVPVDCDAAGFRMKKAANLAPKVASRDLIALSLGRGLPANRKWKHDLLASFNPFLSERACGLTKPLIQTWMKLCVLEDKLDRLRCMSDVDRLQELQVTRTWDTAEHPEWLAFEVEGGIQIRPVQHLVAKILMNDPGAITQLNMGMGKTRVVLPMLLLHWAKGKEIVRLHFLSQLLGEAFEHLHVNMCAGTMLKKLFVLPFHRDIDLTVDNVHAMLAALDYCRGSGGALVVAPEHRLSLQLKWHEETQRGTEDRHVVCTELTRLYRLPYRDILDESDELLRPQYQLIYAVGDSLSLPDGPSRWRSAAALLRVASANKHFRKLLGSKGAAKTEKERWAGAFSEIQLLPGANLDELRLTMLRTLMAALFVNPPYEMMWMNGCNDEAKHLIMNFTTETGYFNEEVFSNLVRTLGCGSQLQDVLSLRGFLAFGIFEHCLQKRNRVDYGVFRKGGKKRLAVPFRANDTPALRAEFSHPDTAITLTYLAYYYDGLSKLELRTAFGKLLSLGINAQRYMYSEWFNSSKDSMNERERKDVDVVSKIDLTNTEQFECLFNHYRFNIEAINFWLEHCVLPVETMQYPHRLLANAWNLVDNTNKRVVGFSGTNDTHRLLPLLVHQHQPQGNDQFSAQLRATNGKMIHLLVSRTLECSLIEHEAKVPWKEVILHVLKFHHKGRILDALIDAGGLMAGASNAQVGEEILKNQDGFCSHVVYFDKAKGDWVVHDSHGEVCVLSRSPVEERDAFVYFDESHCRGADMKLREDAIALLTLGPGISKDKLMQAAGRMRQLDKKQNIVIAAFPDTVSSIREINKVSAMGKHVFTPRHVINWALDNTVKMNENGLHSWALQGRHWICTKGHPDRALIPERLELKDYYGYKSEIQVASVAIKVALNTGPLGLVSETGSHKMDLGARSYIQKILSQVEKHGADFNISCAGLEEECERELEREEEEEKEIEVQAPKKTPRKERDWEYSMVMHAQNPEELPCEARVQSLDVAIDNKLSQAVSCIPWGRNLIYCTSNFIDAVDAKAHDQYLRPIDALLVFPSGGVLLVSEREADKILALFWRDSAIASPAFVNLAYFLPGKFKKIVERLEKSECRLSLGQAISVSAAGFANLQLFNGETMYANSEVKDKVRAILRDESARRSAIEHVQNHGLHHTVAYSDLELLCAGYVRESLATAQHSSSLKRSASALGALVASMEDAPPMKA